MTAPLKSHKHSNKPTNFHPLPVLPLKWLCTHICSACGDIVVAGSPSLYFVQWQHSFVCTHTNILPWKHLNIWKKEIVFVDVLPNSIKQEWFQTYRTMTLLALPWCQMLHVLPETSKCVYSQCKLADPVGFGVSLKTFAFLVSLPFSYTN